MCRIRLSEALYRLGELRSEPGVRNRDLLRLMVGIASESTGAQMIVGVVYEGGIGSEPSAIEFEGVLPRNESSPRGGSLGRVPADRQLLRQLATAESGHLYKRSELIEETLDAESTENAETWYARFERPDGAEFVLIFAHDESVAPARCGRAGVVARYVGRTWTRVWTSEPSWLRDLRPAARRVLELVVQGYDDEQISKMTGLTYHSVRAHLKRLFRQANVRSRLHLIQASRRAWSDSGDQFKFVSPAEAGISGLGVGVAALAT